MIEQLAYFDPFDIYGKDRFENAIAEARRFVRTWEFYDGPSSDKLTAYTALPSIVKDALEWLVYTEEIY